MKINLSVPTISYSKHLPAPMITYSEYELSSDVNLLIGTQVAPSVTIYSGGQIDGTMDCWTVAFTSWVEKL